MLHIMFVCLGNICRSPLAEHILKKLIDQANFTKKIEVASSGTSSFHIGEDADSRTRANAQKNGIKIIHSAQQFKVNFWQEYDYILAMDRSNFNNVMGLKNNIALSTNAQLFLMRDFDEVKSKLDVPDPYYSDEQGFQEVFDILYNANINFLNFLVEKHNLQNTL